MSSLAISVGRLGRGQVSRVFVTGYSQKRHKSEHSLTDYTRGKGGRSSFSGIVATVFGASGWLGPGVVNRLGKIGCQVIIPYRGDSYSTDKLKVAGDLGQILFTPFESIYDESAIRRSMMHSNVVINLIGRDWETDAYGFHEVNVEIPSILARIARESGIERFVHVSHLNASPRPPRYIEYRHAVVGTGTREKSRFVFDKRAYDTSGSRFLTTKYEGELEVREEFPEAVIIKPSDIFGFKDRYINLYISEKRRVGNVIKMWKKGERTIKQPVFYSDVVSGIINAVRNPDAAGKTYAAVGPNRYHLSDIIDFMYRVLRYPEFTRAEVDFWYMLNLRKQANKLMPHMTFDLLERECVTDVVPEDMYTLEDLGVPMPLTTLEERLKSIIGGRQRRRIYERELSREHEVFRPPPKLKMPQLPV